MRGLAALLVAFAALATPARADVSDSGNLNIGGQAVIVGSMTISGAGGLGVAYGMTASSVTASSATLTAAGAEVYALTSSTGIHVLNGQIKLESGSYIRWPDNTTSTTSSAGSGSTTLPTRQILTSTTSATYTTPAGVRQLRIRMVGGGGGGGFILGYAGGGGGAGEYAELIVDSPGATYSYAVGDGGVGGVCANVSGGAGGSGVIIVDEYY